MILKFWNLLQIVTGMQITENRKEKNEKLFAMFYSVFGFLAEYIALIAVWCYNSYVLWQRWDANDRGLN